jgi:hypothetical protein
MDEINDVGLSSHIDKLAEEGFKMLLNRLAYQH